MASEDNFLRLDPYCWQSEAAKRAFEGEITLSDAEDFFKKGYITREEFEFCAEILGENYG